MFLAAEPLPYRKFSLMDFIMETRPYSTYSLCLTLAILIFAILIIRNRWGMGYRLSLIPASLMPLLIGFGGAGAKLMNLLNFDPSHYRADLACGLTSNPRECFVIIPLCGFQTALLLAVTAFAFFDLKNGPPAALIATRPEP